MSGDEDATVPAVCVFATADGTSRLADIRLPTLRVIPNDSGPSTFLGTYAATLFGVVKGGAATAKDWHISATAGLSIVLNGAWEIEAGSGQRRRLGPGSILVMLDTHGQGHRAHYDPAGPCDVIGVGIGEAARAEYEALVAGLV
ncbi:MAG: hypothetical protein PW843_30235 [Azospirillaceae bacterium]|nr:hypothetical protein [Azospirillaceae bacterium]